MADDPLIGKIIAGHRLERLIGQGGQSVVYLAEHVRLGRKRAVKLLPSHFAEDQVARARFEEEWKGAAAIEHPAIVEVFDAGELEGQLYIVMRYVPGSDLGALVANEGMLAPDRALWILDEVAQALDAAHAAGLVHRDVKPANILVGAGDRAYLSDFGVAKLARPAEGLTRAGYFVGTADYAAPEQIENGEVDGRADVYSLGCVLYYCLTGSVPFPRETQSQVMAAQVHDPPPRLTERRPDLSPAMDGVLATALAKDPAARYSMCLEFVAAATEAAKQPVPAGAAPAPAGVTREMRRPSAAGDTAPARGVPVPVQPPPAPPERPPSTPRAARRRVGVNGVLGGLAGFVVLVGIGLAIWFAALKPGAKAASPPAHPKPPAAGKRRFSLQVCGDFANGICINPGLSRSADDKQFVAVETVTNVHGGDTARFVLKDPDTASTLAESNTLRAQRAFRTFYFTDTIGNNGKPLGARRIEVIVYFNGGLLKPSVTVEFR